jgi:aspartate dehydrogenase
MPGGELGSMQARGRVKVVFIGWGAIGSRVGDLLAKREAPVEIAGIATIDEPAARAALPRDIPFIGDPARLAEIRPDLVVEAAGRRAIDQWAPAALQHAKAMIIASTSAFCDDALLPRLAAIAERYGSRILIPSGAIGAIDAIASASVLGLDAAVHQVVKPPAAWKGTPAEKLFDAATLAKAQIFYDGTAREAARDYPQNANATVVTSLAGIGIDKTRVQLVVDPAARVNEHRIMVRGAFGELEIVLRNNPLATNPKSSELTALSLVRLIEQQGRTVVI